MKIPEGMVAWNFPKCNYAEYCQFQIISPTSWGVRCGMKGECGDKVMGDE